MAQVEQEPILFPSDDIDPNAKNQMGAFINAVGRAIFYKYRRGSTYYGYADVGRLTQIRDYSNGNQSPSIYQNQWLDAGDERTTNQGQAPSPQFSKVGRRGFQNMSWEIFSLAPELKRVMMSLIGTSTQVVSCENISRDIKNKKTKMKHKLFIKAKLRPLLEQMGVPVKKEYFEPSNEVALELYELIGGFLQNFERTIQLYAKHGLDSSEYHTKIERQLKADLIDFNFIVTKTYTDPNTGCAKVKYIDPARFVCAYMEESMGDNTPYAGHFEKYSIPELRTKLLEYFTPEQAETYIQDAARYIFNTATTKENTALGWSYWSTKDTVTNRFRYDEMFIDVLEFQYISKDDKYYKKKIREDGSQSFYPDQYGERVSTDKKKTVVYSMHNVYEGTFIPGCDITLGGRQFNSLREDTRTPVLDYAIEKVLGKSIGESAIPIHDAIMFGHIKLEAAKRAAKPKGISIELGSINSMKIGGELFSPFDIVKVYDHRGILFHKSLNAQGRIVSSGKPIEELEGGIGRQQAEWVQDYAFNVERLLQITGITPMAAASPNISGEKGKGVSAMEIQATSNNLYPLQEALENMKVKVSKRLIMRSLSTIYGDKEVRKYYEDIFGKDQVEETLIAQGTTLEQMGIKLSAKVSEQQKQTITEAALIALREGRNGVPLITPADMTFIQDLLEQGRIMEAGRYLDYQTSERTKQINDQAAAASAQQSEQLMQLEQVKQQGTLQLEQGKAEIEVRKETVLSKIRVQEELAKKLPIIEAEKEAEAELLNVEAMVQLLTGKDAGARVPVQGQQTAA